MDGTGEAPRGFPSWIDAVGAPVWISDPTGGIAYVNSRAERLLGIAAADCIGRPCHEVVGGRDAQGRPHCGPHCPIAARARRHSEIEPFEMSVGRSPETERWVQVLIIKVGTGADHRPWLVHCAISRNKAHRIETYLAKVAARTESRAAREAGRQELTPREREILGLLADDHDLYTIAGELHISYVTVRNHVQHVLAKLGVHSMMEAVACYLLLEGDGKTKSRPRSESRSRKRRIG